MRIDLIFQRPGALLLALAAGTVLGLAAQGSLSPVAAWWLFGAPLLEEVVFRLGLQQSLLQAWQHRWPRHGSWLANGVTALAFALAHVLMRPSALAAATVLPALAIGLVYGRTRRLLPCVLLHALFNLIGLAWFGLPPSP